MLASTSSSAMATPLSDRLVRPDLDLDRRLGRKTGDADGAPGRAVSAERLRIDVVDLRHVPDGGREHRDLGDVRERRAAVGEDGRDVGQGLTGLAPDALGQLTRRRIESDLTGEDDPVAGAHRR